MVRKVIVTALLFIFLASFVSAAWDVVSNSEEWFICDAYGDDPDETMHAPTLGEMERSNYGDPDDNYLENLQVLPAAANKLGMCACPLPEGYAYDEEFYIEVNGFSNFEFRPDCNGEAGNDPDQMFNLDGTYKEEEFIGCCITPPDTGRKDFFRPCREEASPATCPQCYWGENLGTEFGHGETPDEEGGDGDGWAAKKDFFWLGQNPWWEYGDPNLPCTDEDDNPDNDLGGTWCEEGEQLCDGLVVAITNDESPPENSFCCQGTCEPITGLTCEELASFHGFDSFDIIPNEEGIYCRGEGLGLAFRDFEGQENDEICCLGGYGFNEERIPQIDQSNAFICHREQEHALFAECCYEDACDNKRSYIYNPISPDVYDAGNIFSTGSALHTILSFDKLLDPSEGAGYGDRIRYWRIANDHTSKEFSNFPINDWSDYNYLEFDMAFEYDTSLQRDDPPRPTKMEIFSGNDVIWERSRDSLYELSTTGQVPRYFHHFVIDLNNDGSEDDSDAGLGDRSLITKIKFSYDGDAGANAESDIVYFDNFALRDSWTTTSDYATRYCSGVFRTWVDTLNPKLNSISTVPALEEAGPYWYACDAQMSFKWSGTRCCGSVTAQSDTLAEYYEDLTGGCWNGFFVPSSKRVIEMTLDSNDKRVLFSEGTFQSCGAVGNKQSVDLDDPSRFNSVNPIEQDTCEIVGDYFCDSNGFWERIYDAEDGEPGMFNDAFTGALAFGTVPPSNLVVNGKFDHKGEVIFLPEAQEYVWATYTYDEQTFATGKCLRTDYACKKTRKVTDNSCYRIRDVGTDDETEVPVPYTIRIYYDDVNSEWTVEKQCSAGGIDRDDDVENHLAVVQAGDTDGDGIIEDYCEGGFGRNTVLAYSDLVDELGCSLVRDWSYSGDYNNEYFITEADDCDNAPCLYIHGDDDYLYQDVVIPEDGNYMLQYEGDGIVEVIDIETDDAYGEGEEIFFEVNTPLRVKISGSGYVDAISFEKTGTLVEDQEFYRSLAGTDDLVEYGCVPEGYCWNGEEHVAAYDNSQKGPLWKEFLMADDCIEQCEALDEDTFDCENLCRQTMDNIAVHTNYAVKDEYTGFRCVTDEDSTSWKFSEIKYDPMFMYSGYCGRSTDCFLEVGYDMPPGDLGFECVENNVEASCEGLSNLEDSGAACIALGCTWSGESCEGALAENYCDLDYETCSIAPFCDALGQTSVTRGCVLEGTLVDVEINQLNRNRFTSEVGEGDYICVNGKWNSRTQAVATYMMNLVSAEEGNILEDIDEYTIFCDEKMSGAGYKNDPDEGLAGFMHEGSVNVAPVMEVDNPICALRYSKNGEEYVLLGTSLNAEYDLNDDIGRFLYRLVSELEFDGVNNLFNENDMLINNHDLFRDQQCGDDCAFAICDDNEVIDFEQLDEAHPFAGRQMKLCAHGGEHIFGEYDMMVAFDSNKDIMLLTFGASDNSAFSPRGTWFEEFWDWMKEFFGFGQPEEPRGFFEFEQAFNRIYFYQNSERTIKATLEEKYDETVDNEVIQEAIFISHNLSFSLTDFFEQEIQNDDNDNYDWFVSGVDDGEPNEEGIRELTIRKASAYRERSSPYYHVEYRGLDWNFITAKLRFAIE